MRKLHVHIVLAILGIFATLWVNIACADPPARVAQLSDISGNVAFSPAGETQWFHVVPNRPMITGDRLWVAHSAQAELQLGTALVHIRAGTSLGIFNLDDQTAQFQLTQGTFSLYVRTLRANQIYEIDTPNLAFVVRTPGYYRLEVDPDTDTTLVTVRNGEGEVYGQNSSYLLNAPIACRFVGTDVENYECMGIPKIDDFDHWAFEHVRLIEHSVSGRYVSSEMIGYNDLDDYGTWQFIPSYGYVWTPEGTDKNWAPYQTGRWVWSHPWGWTWISDEPWGFAPFHYGRWAYIQHSWSWVPGPVTSAPIYAPALVAFLAGPTLVSSAGSYDIAWFPLGPGEPYVPAYTITPKYFIRINASNTQINPDILDALINDQKLNLIYSNRNAPNAITAVPVDAFALGQQVNPVSVSKNVIAKLPILPFAPIAPANLYALAATTLTTDVKPPATAERPVLVKTPLPLQAVPFARQQSELEENPGRPLTWQVLQNLIQQHPMPVNQLITMVNPSRAATISIKAIKEKKPSENIMPTIVPQGPLPQPPIKPKLQ